MFQRVGILFNLIRFLLLYFLVFIQLEFGGDNISPFQVSDECSLTLISRETEKTTLNFPTYFIHTEHNFTKILKPVAPKIIANMFKI